MKYKPAFSLVEMLMALLVASLLLAALAPVMTKRLNDNVSVTVPSKSDSGYKIFTTDDADCEEVEGQNYMKCAFTVPNDVTQLNIYMQGAGGGGAAAIPAINEICEFNTATGNNSANTVICKSRYNDVKYWNAINTSVKGVKIGRYYLDIFIAPGMQNLSALLIAPGGGGGGGIYHSKPVHQNDCENIKPGVLKYLTAEQNGGVAACVTKFAVADDGYGGPTALVSGNTVVKAGVTCDSGACCWQDVSGECDIDPSGGRTGCSRPVCTWDAANNACNNYHPGNTKIGDWSLPEEPEIAAWFAHLNEVNNYKGADGLQLCSFSGNTGGTSWCKYKVQGCPGSLNGVDNGACHMQHIWSKTPIDAEHYKNWAYDAISGGVYYTATTHKYTRKASRCITKKAYTNYGGAGGASGSITRIFPHEKMDSLLKEYAGKAHIHTFTDPGNPGGESAANSETGAKDGDSQLSNIAASGMHVYMNTGGSIVKFINNTYGGRYGNGASISSNGIKAKYNDTFCWSNVLNADEYECTPSKEGKSGTSTAGGTGGKAVYTLLNGTTISCTAAGGNNSSKNEDGKTASCYGAGGGGGSATTEKNGAGGKSGDGYIEVSYEVKRKGAPGGGGGGGAALAYRSVPVTPGETIYFYVGKGGAGGTAADWDGKDGGDSWFEMSSTGKVIAGGGFGGKQGNNDDIIPVGGEGGEGGKYSNAAKANLKKNGNIGQDGYYDEKTSNSTGGNGGLSDNSETMSCGGLNKNDKCSNTTINGQSFIPVFEVLIKTLLNKSKADSGQGGGGGAFLGGTDNGKAGNGGKGTDGYIYIRWNVLK